MRKSKITSIPIAVVVRKTSDNVLVSRRPRGDWAAFLGTTQEEAVQRALDAAVSWNGTASNGYVVLAGLLTAKVNRRVAYKLEKI